jgi:hypothetical protein
MSQVKSTRENIFKRVTNEIIRKLSNSCSKERPKFCGKRRRNDNCDKMQEDNSMQRDYGWVPKPAPYSVFHQSFDIRD